jgi:O-antigen ligase
MNSLAYAALWLFVFSVPWERMVVLPGVSIVSRATGALALGVTLLSVVIYGRFRRWHGFQVAALLFVVWAGCIAMLTQYREFPPKYFTFVQLFLVLCMIWELAQTRSRVVGLFTAYVMGAYVAALDTILLYRTRGEMMRRFAAGGADPNDLAMILALGIPMAWYLAMSYRKPIVQWLCRGYLLVALVGLGLTGSRGGMVAAVVGLLIVPLTLTKLSPGKRVLGMVLISLGLAAAAVYTPATLVERLASTGTDVSDAHLGGRFQIWMAGIHAFTLQPLLGYGTSMFKTAVRPFGVDQVAHNAFLSVLVEQGLIGLLIFLSIFLAVLLSLMRLPSFDRRFGLVLFATLFVAMLPLTWEDDKSTWVILASLMALAYAPRLTAPSAAWAPPRPAGRAAPGWRPRPEPAGARGPSRIDAGT